MKLRYTKRILTLLLGLALTASLCSTALSVSAASSYDYCVQNGSGTREPMRVTGTLSYRAIVNQSFTGFSFAMPTWNNAESYATLSIYKWLGTYEATLAEQPIAAQTFNPLADNQQNWVTFDPQPAGEYLFHISEGSYDVGVWTNLGPNNPKGFLYLDGKEQRGEPELRVRLQAISGNAFGN